MRNGFKAQFADARRRDGFAPRAEGVFTDFTRGCAVTTLAKTYGVFVVRIWLEESGGSSAWRASVTDTSTKEKRYFAEPAALSSFLLAPLPGETWTGLEPDA